MSQELVPSTNSHSIASRVSEIKALSLGEKIALLNGSSADSSDKLLPNRAGRTLPEWSTTVGVLALGTALLGSIWLLDQDGNKDTPAPSSFAQTGVGTEKELRERRAELAEAAKVPILQSRAELIEKALIKGRQEARYKDILTNKTLTVIELAKPVTMEVTTDMGIWVRWFTTRKVKGNLVPTNAPGDQAQLKAWTWGERINDPIKQFVLEQDKQSHQAVLFAVTSRGDIEYWPVYDSEDPDSPYGWFNRDGKSILLASILTEEGVVRYQAF